METLIEYHKLIELVTREGVLRDKIEIRITVTKWNGVDEVTTKIFPNTEQNWKQLNDMSRFPGIKVMQVHIMGDGREERWEWKESPAYKFRSKKYGW